MSETLQNPRATVIDIPSPEGVRIEQTSTRGEGLVEQREAYESTDIDFSQVSEHLSIHTDGEVAGSQFSGEIFESPIEVVELVKHSLPESLHYDQHGRTELTLSIEGAAIGYSGVKSLQELENTEGVQLTRGNRMPGGEPAEMDGIKGAWYPEMARNPNTGQFEVVRNTDGSIKNPHGKFEPEAWIAHVEEGSLPTALATDKVTVILQKNPDSSVPTVLTIFPGENAPAYPARIETEAYQADSLQAGSEVAYWSEHAFIKGEGS